MVRISTLGTFRFLIITLSLCCMLFITSAASTGNSIHFDVKINSKIALSDVEPGYPGLMPWGNGFTEYSVYWVKLGIRSYYEMYGHWPENWAAVVDEKLFQTDLITPEGNIIDPDDGTLDFFGDIFLFPHEPDAEQLRLAYLRGFDGVDVKHIMIDKPLTTKEVYTQYIEFYEVPNREQVREYFEPRLDDPIWLKQIAIGAMLSGGISLYHMVHEDLPPSWDDLLASGLAPIKADSLNPLTGQPFAGDGGTPLDYLYEYTPAAETGWDKSARFFVHIEADGSRPSVFLHY